MQAGSLPNTKIQALVDKGLFDRLPPSFTSFFFQRIQEWKLLFPAEQQYFERLFGVLDRSAPAEVEKLFAPLRSLEQKMGVNPKTWNPREFTLQHVDFLNRSPYYNPWRDEIRRIFSVLDPLLDEEVARSGRRRLVCVLAPFELPIGADRMWTRLLPHGKRVRLAVEDSADFLSVLMRGKPAGESGPSLLTEYAKRKAEPYDCWVVEADDRLGSLAGEGVIHLSYKGLEDYRQRLMKRVDRLVKDESVSSPRELGKRLKRMVLPTAYAVLDDSPVLAEFIRSVMLAGNGTLLINNTFVEWTAIQAARRARPHVTLVSFGIRNKMKPFSSLLIYADQDKTNIIPSQMDTLASYVDLEVFYQYVWQGFEKYAEYRNKTVYLFLGEHLDEAFVIAPPQFPPLSDKRAVPLHQLHADCKAWLSG